MEIMEKVTPFLMFEGNAEEAMSYYTSLVEDSKITSISRYGSEGPGKEGTVIQATFTLKGQEFMCIDSYIQHKFTFTPSYSMFITCSNVDEIDYLFEKLSEGGEVLMPMDDYGFSKKFAWVADKFGVSWQLNLSH
jgi:predicted 3-demethylubiquinone-9 3-methyltransferase (glyoxalase superfamily)